MSIKRFALSLMLFSSTFGVAEESINLQEVVITATLRPTVVLDIPASVTVLSNATLREAGLEHLQDVVSLIPNLNFAMGSSRPRYFQLRGIGETEQWQGAPNPSVGFLIDGMNFSGVGMPATLIDLKQIEVLRGPQGTTLGANALAGLININTQRPTTSPLVRFEVIGGESNTRALAGIFGGTLIGNPDSSWRLVAQRFRSDGFRHNITVQRDDTNDLDETTLRAGVRWAPDGPLTADISALWVNLDNGFDAFSLDNSRLTLSDKPGRDTQVSRGLSATLDYLASENYILRSVSAFSDANINYTFDGDWGADRKYDFTSSFVREHRTISQDLRALSSLQLSGAGSSDWILGLYGLRVIEANDQLDLYNGEIYRALQSDYSANQVALYGNYRYQMTLNYLVSAGLRGERRTTRYTDSDGSRLAPGEQALGGNLSVEYSFDPHRRAYITLARGYKGGGFNIGVLVPDTRRKYAPEFLHSVELGYKFNNSERTLSLDLAAFVMRRIAQQASTSVQLILGDPLSFIYLTENAARGVNFGLEGSAAWQASERVFLGVSLGVLRARFLSYELGPENLNGRDQAHSPRYQVSVTASYRTPLGWYVRTDAQKVAAFYYSDSHSQQSTPYILANLRAGYETERWGASVWVKNALNQNYAQRGFYFGNEPPDYPNRLYVQKADPRQGGVSLWYAMR